MAAPSSKRQCVLVLDPSEWKLPGPETKSLLVKSSQQVLARVHAFCGIRDSAAMRRSCRTFYKLVNVTTIKDDAYHVVLRNRAPPEQDAETWGTRRAEILHLSGTPPLNQVPYLTWLKTIAPRVHTLDLDQYLSTLDLQTLNDGGTVNSSDFAFPNATEVVLRMHATPLDNQRNMTVCKISWLLGSCYTKLRKLILTGPLGSDCANVVLMQSFRQLQELALPSTCIGPDLLRNAADGKYPYLLQLSSLELAISLNDTIANGKTEVVDSLTRLFGQCKRLSRVGIHLRRAFGENVSTSEQNGKSFVDIFHSLEPLGKTLVHAAIHLEQVTTSEGVVRQETAAFAMEPDQIHLPILERLESLSLQATFLQESPVYNKLFERYGKTIKQLTLYDSTSFQQIVSGQHVLPKLERLLLTTKQDFPDPYFRQYVSLHDQKYMAAVSKWLERHPKLGRVDAAIFGMQSPHVLCSPAGLSLCDELLQHIVPTPPRDVPFLDLPGFPSVGGLRMSLTDHADFKDASYARDALVKTMTDRRKNLPVCVAIDDQSNFLSGDTICRLVRCADTWTSRRKWWFVRDTTIATDSFVRDCMNLDCDTLILERWSKVGSCKQVGAGAFLVKDNRPGLKHLDLSKWGFLSWDIADFRAFLGIVNGYTTQCRLTLLAEKIPSFKLESLSLFRNLRVTLTPVDKWGMIIDVRIVPV